MAVTVVTKKRFSSLMSRIPTLTLYKLLKTDGVLFSAPSSHSTHTSLSPLSSFHRQPLLKMDGILLFTPTTTHLPVSVPIL